jgi:hypothetical protein
MENTRTFALPTAILAHLGKVYGHEAVPQIHGALEELWNSRPFPLSLYLRGSVVTSTDGGIPLDLDLYLIEENEPIQGYDMFELNKALRQRFHSLPVIDASFLSVLCLRDSGRRLMTRLILRKEGTLLFGEELLSQLPEDQLDLACAASLSFKQSLIVEKKLLRAVNQIASISAEDVFWQIYNLKSMAKATLRLAMPFFVRDENRFERGIDLCAKKMLLERPELSNSVNTLLMLLGGEQVDQRMALRAAITLFERFGFDADSK